MVIEVRRIDPKKGGARTASGRFIKNLQPLIRELRQRVPGIEVTAQDFSLLSFKEQISLAHSADLLISMVRGALSVWCMWCIVCVEYSLYLFIVSILYLCFSLYLSYLFLSLSLFLFLFSTYMFTLSVLPLQHGAGTTHIFHMAIGEKNCCGLLELFPDRTVDLYTAQGYSNLARQLGLKHERLVARDGATSSQGTEVEVDKVVQGVLRLKEKMKETPTCLHEVKDTRYPIYGEHRHGW